VCVCVWGKCKRLHTTVVTTARTQTFTACRFARRVATRATGTATNTTAPYTNATTASGQYDTVPVRLSLPHYTEKDVTGQYCSKQSHTHAYTAGHATTTAALAAPIRELSNACLYVRVKGEIARAIPTVGRRATKYRRHTQTHLPVMAVTVRSEAGSSGKSQSMCTKATPGWGITAAADGRWHTT
jgi:hypothetical protein